MESLGDPPSNAPQDGDDDTFLKDVAGRVVQLIWHDPRVNKILASDEEKENNYTYCLCKTDLGDDVPMVFCSGIHCPGNRWFHLQCLNMEEDDIPDEFYCSDDCRKRTVYKYCSCHVDMGEYEPMVGCDNQQCKTEWFHLKCVGLKDAPAGKWFCSKDCKIASSKKKKLKSEPKEDGVYNYVTGLMFVGLMDLVRHDAVRENDGQAMMSHWKLDMILFHNNHHPKYVLLGHRLLAGVSGWLPERLAMDSMWNRTVNLAGGPGRNLECDIVNEFLNKEFKESLKDAGGNLTEETVHRHSQMAGSLGRVIDKVYAESVEAPLSEFIRKGNTNFTRDLELFVKLLLPEHFFRHSPGRHFKSYQDFSFSIEAKHPEKLKKKLCQLSKRLDKIRRCTD
uniref:Zinc finger PHD-type domain-containing protein n=1 Tax=Magallana gigas TaxID=29159 RepID=A0A8W8IKI6_MAGGI